MSSPQDRLAAFDARLGAFARIFPRPTAAELAEAFVRAELVQVQLNVSALGLPTIPSGDRLAGLDLAAIAGDLTARGRRLWGISATYNMAHPDETVRARSTGDAADYIARMAGSGAVAATLCTGSRDPDDMWAKHPDNGGEAAWHAMMTSMRTLVAAARTADVLLAVEPEPGNVVADAHRALRLVDELGDDAASIGFILDPANLVAEADPAAAGDVLTEAFALLGDRTVCVHAKDTVAWSESLAGRGRVDYDLVLALHAGLPEPVPLIIQDAREDEVAAIRDRLRAAFLALAP